MSKQSESYTSFSELLADDCVPLNPADDQPKHESLISRLLMQRPSPKSSSGLQRWLDSDSPTESPLPSPTLSTQSSPTLPIEPVSSDAMSFFSLTSRPASPLRLEKRLPVNQSSPIRPIPRSAYSNPIIPKRKAAKPPINLAEFYLKGPNPIHELFGPLQPASGMNLQPRTVSMPSLARRASARGSSSKGMNAEKVEMRFEAQSGRKRRANTLEMGAREMLLGGLKRSGSVVSRPSSRPSSRGPVA